MLLSLIIKYFIYNHKRTFQATLVVSAGIMLFVSSVGIMNGFSTQTRLLSSLIPPSSEITIKSTDGLLTYTTVSRIDLFMKKYHLDEVQIIKLNSSVGFLLTSVGKTKCRIIFVSPELFNNYFNANLDRANGSVAIGSSLSNFVGATRGYVISFYLENGEKYLFKEIDLVMSSPSWVLNYLFYLDPKISLDGKYSYNEIKIKFPNAAEAERYATLLKEEIPGILVDQESGAGKYFEASFNEVLRVLWVFELAFGIMAILSVGYTFYTLVKESEYEINVFKALGFSNQQIFYLYYGQIILSGLLGGLVGVIIGLFGANAAISLAAGIFGFPYFLSNISMELFWQIMSFSVTITIIGGVYPSFLAAFQKIGRGRT